MIKMKQQKQGQVLPADVRAQLLYHKDVNNKGLLRAHIRVLRRKGWTYQCIGDALSLTRERARQLSAEAHFLEINRIEEDPIFSTFIPKPPMIAYEVPDVHVPIQPTAATLQRLLELQPIAEKVRYNRRGYRVEAEEYASLLHHALTVEKVTMYQLAKVMGVTRMALHSRLVRYGYSTTNCKGRMFEPIREENRVRS